MTEELLKKLHTAMCNDNEHQCNRLNNYIHTDEYLTAEVVQVVKEIVVEETKELEELYKKADENWWNAQQIIKEQQEQIEKMKCCTEWQIGEPIKGREIFARNVANCNLLADYYGGAWRNVWNGAVIDFNKITMWRYTGFKNNGEEIDCKEIKEK